MFAYVLSPPLFFFFFLHHIGRIFACFPFCVWSSMYSRVTHQCTYVVCVFTHLCVPCVHVSFIDVRIYLCFFNIFMHVCFLCPGCLFLYSKPPTMYEKYAFDWVCIYLSFVFPSCSGGKPRVVRRRMESTPSYPRTQAARAQPLCAARPQGHRARRKSSKAGRSGSPTHDGGNPPRRWPKVEGECTLQHCLVPFWSTVQQQDSKDWRVRGTNVSFKEIDRSCLLFYSLCLSCCRGACCCGLR